MHIPRTCLALLLTPGPFLLLPARGAAQTAEATSHRQQATAPEHAEADREPATDLTVFFGSDFVRPGLLPRSNLSVVLGHRFGFLKHDPLGASLVFAYTYENTGTHGFIHTRNGEHTEDLGLSRDIRFPHTERFSAYTIVQAGLSSLTGDRIQNRFSVTPGAGLVVHLSRTDSLWVQELYNKVVTIPWYTVTSVGYTRSF